MKQCHLVTSHATAWFVHDVLTVAGCITACPRPIIDILADTQVVPMQCVTTVKFVGGSCTHKRWSSLLVAHHAICDGQKWTVINYNQGWCHSTIIKCTHGTVTIDTSGMHDIVGRAQMRHRLHVSTFHSTGTKLTGWRRHTWYYTLTQHTIHSAGEMVYIHMDSWKHS